MDLWVIMIDDAPPPRPGLAVCNVMLRRYRNVDGRTFEVSAEQRPCASVADAYHHLPGDRNLLRRSREPGRLVEIWV